MPRMIHQTSISSNHQRDDGEDRHHHRGFDAVAHPGDGNLARTIGDPANAGGDDRERSQEKDDTDHPGLTACQVRASFRAAIDAQRRTRPAGPAAFVIHSCAGARAAASSLPRSAMASSIVGVRRFNLDACQHGGRIVACRRIDGTDAHKLAGVCFQPLQKTAVGACAPEDFIIAGISARSSCASAAFVGAPFSANGASGARTFSSAPSDFHFVEFRSEWHAAHDRFAQRGCAQRQPRRLSAGALWPFAQARRCVFARYRLRRVTGRPRHSS